MHRILVDKPEWKNTFERPRCRCDDSSHSVVSHILTAVTENALWHVVLCSLVEVLMEVVGSCETSVRFYQTKRQHVQEESN